MTKARETLADTIEFAQRARREQIVYWFGMTIAITFTISSCMLAGVVAMEGYSWLYFGLMAYVILGFTGTILMGHQYLEVSQWRRRLREDLKRFAKS